MRGCGAGGGAARARLCHCLGDARPPRPRLPPLVMHLLLRLRHCLLSHDGQLVLGLCIRLEECSRELGSSTCVPAGAAGALWVQQTTQARSKLPGLFPGHRKLPLPWPQQAP